MNTLPLPTAVVVGNRMSGIGFPQPVHLSFINSVRFRRLANSVGRASIFIDLLLFNLHSERQQDRLQFV